MQKIEFAVQVFEPLIQVWEIYKYGDGIFVVVCKPDNSFIQEWLHFAKHDVDLLQFDFLHTTMSGVGLIVNSCKIPGEFFQLVLFDLNYLQ